MVKEQFGAGPQKCKDKTKLKLNNNNPTEKEKKKKNSMNTIENNARSIT